MIRDPSIAGLGLAALLLATLNLPGCNSCNEPTIPAKSPSSKAAAGAAAATAKATADHPAPSVAIAAKAGGTGDEKAPVEAKDPGVYRGPTSTNTAGYTITTGFSDEKARPLLSPQRWRRRRAT